MTIILIGNKVDLENDREVSYEEGLQFAKKYNLNFFETSAKTALNVEKAFLATTQTIYDNINRGEYDLSNESIGIKPGNEFNHPMPTTGSRSANLSGGKKQQNKEGGCC